VRAVGLQVPTINLYTNDLGLFCAPKNFCICVGIPLHFQSYSYTILVEACHTYFRFPHTYGTLKRTFN